MIKKREDDIWEYLSKNHVISITTSDGQSLWSFNAFYAFDQETHAVILMSNEHTRHGKMLKDFSKISGTISDQSYDVKTLKGLQFNGVMTISEDVRDQQIYIECFPFVANMSLETIWKLVFEEIKYTDNSLGFGTKISWAKEHK